MILTKQRAVSAGLRSLACVFVITLASVGASAYTLVMRDGRRLSIPDNFVVTNLTLTYVAGERIQITLLLASINIPATERANNQPPGTFLKRAQVSSAIQAEGSVSQRQITNRDLERYRAARLESEVAYERRRKELGLPSLDELRKQSVTQAEETAKSLREMRAREEDSENYWRARASGLRAELAATNARIDFIRARLIELPANAPFGILATELPFTRLNAARFGPVVSTAVIQRSSIGHRHNQIPFVPHFQPRVGSRFSGRVDFVGRSSSTHLSFGQGGFRGLRKSSGLFPITNTLVAVPFQDHLYERSELMVQLNELLGHRAGLQARWRDLEEEARRAGVYPGWLRP